MKVGIVNQFTPPDDAPTAVLAGELAAYLEGEGHEVHLISCGSGYRQRRSFKGSRIISELCAHLRLLWKCLRFRKADVLLALSSPACLPATVSLAARLKRCRFAHWAMDVYPEVAVALDEIPRGGLLHRMTAAMMRKAYRRADPLVALTPTMAKAIGEPAEICPPWPPGGLQWPVASDSRPATFTWLYSGNLGRAHLHRPLLMAQKKLEERGIPAELVFQGRGHLIAEAKKFANELSLRRCTFRDYVPKEDLLRSLFDANVLVATQNPATDGLLWPSKLAVIRHVPRPLLWVGDSDPSIDASAFAPDDIDGIAAWIENQVSQPSKFEYSPPEPPQQALQHWNQWLIRT